MTLTTYCAVCGEPCGPDSDHVEVEAEHVRFDDRNEQEHYHLHVRCWENLTGGWIDPA